MKYIVVLCDGMADYPINALNDKTPLEVAFKPNMDRLCCHAEIGLAKTVPDSLSPGSDVANLAVMGYNPLKYYSGRSPLEALSIGVDLKDEQIAMRANLVTLSQEPDYRDKTMIDYSAGEISTEEARVLIDYLSQNLIFNGVRLYAGISYRHCLVIDNAVLGSELTPPHDITGKKVVLPKGIYSNLLIHIQEQSYKLLQNHPINLRRIKEGKNPANSLWFWGEGVKPKLIPFEEMTGLKGAVISAVDLLKGIGICAKMKVINVLGATGNLDTNYLGKAKASLECLKTCDYVYIHIEAPDEMGHQGLLNEKIKAIEYIDKYIIGVICEELDSKNIDYRMLVCPDHPTPLSLRTHTRDPIPYFIYDKDLPLVDRTFDERTAKDGEFINEGFTLINRLIKKEA